MHANQTSRFRRLLRGSAEGLVWLGGGSLLGELPHPRRLLAAAPAADVEVLPHCLHACPWGTGRERGGVGEGKGRGRARGRERGLRFPRLLGSRPRVGVAWNDSIVDPFIYSFIHAFIHSFIYAFVHSYSQPSGTRTGTPEVSSRVTSRETSRDTSRGTGVTGGHQPGPETPAGTPDSFPPTLHNFGHRKWFPKSSGRGRGVGDDL